MPSRSADPAAALLAALILAPVPCRADAPTQAVTELVTTRTRLSAGRLRQQPR